jgi:hypothetical protein
MSDQLTAYEICIYCCSNQSLDVGPIDDERWFLRSAGLEAEPVSYRPEDGEEVWPHAQQKALYAERKRRIALREHVVDLLNPICKHFGSLGAFGTPTESADERLIVIVAPVSAEPFVRSLANLDEDTVENEHGLWLEGHVRRQMSVDEAFSLAREAWLPRGDFRYPVEGDTCSIWAERIGVSVNRLRQVAERWNVAGRDPQRFRMLAPRNERPVERFEYLFDTESGGLFARGVVGLLVGEPGSGKSTFLLQVAVDALRGSTIDGVRCKSSGDAVTVFVSKEDPQATLDERLERMDPNDEVGGRLVVAIDDSPMDEVIRQISEFPHVDMVVIDTAGAALEGQSTTDGGATRGLERGLTTLARRKNCAIVISHHTTGRPDRGGEDGLPDNIAGSKEWIRAPRYILAFEKKGKLRRLRARKSNSPSSTPIMQEPLWLEYDPNTERHARVSALNAKTGGSSTVSQKTEAREDASTTEIEAVEGAVRCVIARGKYVTRTGARELFEHRCPELGGWKRARVRAAVEEGLASGRLVLAGSQVQVADRAAETQPAEVASD